DKALLPQDATLEWVTPGHPLFETVREDVGERVSDDLRRGTVFYDLHTKLPYRLDVFSASIPELLARRQAANVQVLESWEQMRKEFVGSGRTYEEQLEAEKCGYADALAIKVEQWEKRLAAGGVPDYWAFADVEGFLMFRIIWKDLGGKPDGLEGLQKYFCSDYHNNLPTPKIGNQLGADLLTGNAVAQSGDVMD